MSSAAPQRQAAILELLTRRGFVSVSQLRQELGFSVATLRRDLDRLQHAGQLRRTHGGAVLDGSREVPFALKVGTMVEAKERIAEVAAGMVQDGEAIGFTGGTTTQQVARSLAQRHRLTVVTNALTVAMELARSDVRIIVTGGELRGQTFELVGPLAEPVLAQIHLDLVFVGVDGLSVTGGLTTPNPTEARINRVLIERATRVVVVTDHTKLGRNTFSQIAPIDIVDVLITDVGADPLQIETLKQNGVHVITA